MVDDFVAAEGVLEVGNHVDDVVVVARGDNSRPSGILFIRILGGSIRDDASENPFAFAGNLSGVDTQRSVGDEDFTVVAPLCDGGPTGSHVFNAGIGLIHPFTGFSIVEVVASTTVGGRLVGLMGKGGGHTNVTVGQLIHTVGAPAVRLKVVVGDHRGAVFSILVSVDDNALGGLGSILGSRFGNDFFAHNHLLAVNLDGLDVVLDNTLCKSTEA